MTPPVRSVPLDGNGASSQTATGGRGGRSWAAASAGKIGMWIFLASDTMGFAGLLLAYALLRVRAPAWPDPAARFDRPLAAGLTFVLLLSGALMTGAVSLARGGRWPGARRLCWLTAGAGVMFLGGQAVEFQTLAQVHGVGLTVDHAAALFYVITSYHGLHVLAGVVALVVVAARANGGTRDTVDAGGAPTLRAGALEVVSLYWQFVDVVWIVIFTFLYLLPAGVRGS